MRYWAPLMPAMLATSATAMYAALHTLHIPPCRLPVLYLYPFDCFEVMFSKGLLGMGVEGFERGRRKRGRKKRWEFKAACCRRAVTHESDRRSRRNMVGSSIFWSWKTLRKCSSAVHSGKRPSGMRLCAAILGEWLTQYSEAPSSHTTLLQN